MDGFWGMRGNEIGRILAPSDIGTVRVLEPDGTETEWALGLDGQVIGL